MTSLSTRRPAFSRSTLVSPVPYLGVRERCDPSGTNLLENLTLRRRCPDMTHGFRRLDGGSRDPSPKNPPSAIRDSPMLQYFRMSFVATVLFVSSLLPAESAEERAMEHPTFYRSIRVDGLSIFYREAGPKDAPTLLLLHGLPSSSRMFEPLFARLSDRYHLVAPDYPGFGHSDWPDPKSSPTRSTTAPKS